MKYFELKYDNRWQKALWITDMITPVLSCPFVCFLLLYLLSSILEVFLEVTFFVLFFVSFLVGVALSLYNLFKLQGVFVFDDYIEIVSLHLINKKIFFDEICKLEHCEKYYYNWYVNSNFYAPSAGGRRNCIIITTDKTRTILKVENQQEFVRILEERCNITFDKFSF